MATRLVALGVLGASEVLDVLLKAGPTPCTPCEAHRGSVGADALGVQRGVLLQVTGSTGDCVPLRAASLGEMRPVSLQVLTGPRDTGAMGETGDVCESVEPGVANEELVVGERAGWASTESSVMFEYSRPIEMLL